MFPERDFDVIKRHNNLVLDCNLQPNKMGNSITCFSPSPKKDLLPPWLSPSNPFSKSRKSAATANSSPPKKIQTPEVFDDSYIKQQAQIATMLYQHHLQNNGGDLINILDRSVSTRTPPRSSSSKNYNKKFAKRSQSVSSSNPLSSLHLSHQDVGDEGQQRNHFVLVHGGGLGAWCWYKMIALLKEDKHEVDAIDLTGSGSNFCDINSITTISQYAKPLTDFLANLPHNKKVILVGHDVGGACISHAMEMHPTKVCKAIFVAATMLCNDQSALDIFSQQTCLSDINQRAQKFIYANGKKQQPTAIDFDKSLLEDFLFNRSPSKDVALASVSMRSVPFGPVTQKLSLSETKYGSISRFYIKTDDDFAIPEPVQDAMIQSSPPKQVFHLKGSDHSPFFSKPQALHRLLTEISNIPEK